MDKQFLFGPAGWSYPDWQGTVFPAALPRGFNHLEFLARSMDFVEVNTSFYHIPSLKLTEGWVNKTAQSPGFTFWVKLFQNFTHQCKWSHSERDQFKSALVPLQESGRLTGILAQFPYSFKLNPGNMAYLRRIGDSFPECCLAIEFRHQSWDHPEVHSLFREKNWVWANIDQPNISLNLPLTGHLTHPEIAYFRLHGRNRETWFSNEGRDARYHYDYQLQELTQIADKIKQLQATAQKIFISGNNHYKGYAVKNLLELKKLLLTDQATKPSIKQ